jgi:hypothetical protein
MAPDASVGGLEITIRWIAAAIPEVVNVARRLAKSNVSPLRSS